MRRVKVNRCRRDRNQYYQGDDLCLCYDSWVESRLSAIVCCYRCYARFPLALLSLFVFSPREFDAKAAFVTIDTLHDLHAFAKQRQMLGRRSRVPVSCAGCFVFTCLLALCSLACTSLAYLGEMESSLDLTSSFRTQASNLALSGNLGMQPHVRAACVWSAPRDSRACLGLRGLRRRLAVPSRIFCRPRTRMWLRHTQVILFIGLLYTYGHVC